MCRIMEDMREESLKAGIKMGKKAGIKEGAIQTAKRMLALGKYTLEEISGISGLSLEEVKKLEAEKAI